MGSRRAQNGPQTPKKGPDRPVTGRVHGQNPLGQRLGCLLDLFEPIFAPKWCPLAQFGPRWRPVVQNRKLAVSWAGRTETRFRGHLFPVPTPTFGGYHASEWAKRMFLPTGCPFSRALVCFGLYVLTQKGSKKGSTVSQQ